MQRTQVNVDTRRFPQKALNVLSNLDHTFSTKKYKQELFRLYKLRKSTAMRYLGWLMKINKIKRIDKGTYERIN